MKKIFNLIMMVMICALFVGCAKQKPVSTPVTHHRVSNEYGDQIGGYSPKRYSQAYEYFYTRSLRGDAVAENSLGHIYMDGRGVKANTKKAVYWYEQSAHQGNREAEVNLGVAYLYGRGVKKDVGKACEWFSKAKAQNSRAAFDFYSGYCESR
jgi:TPR repeat protein